MKVASKFWERKDIQLMFKIFLVLGLIVNVAGYYSFVPYSNHVEAVEYGIQVSQDLNTSIKNDWSLGYWIVWHGGVPSEWGSGFESYDDNYFYEGVAITVQDLNECELLKDFNGLKVFDCVTKYKTVEFPVLGKTMGK
jgi:hypothetical protein